MYHYLLLFKCILIFKPWTSSVEVSLKITGYHQLMIFHLSMIRVKILQGIMRLCHFLKYLSANSTGRTRRCYVCMHIPTKRKVAKNQLGAKNEQLHFVSNVSITIIQLKLYLRT